jgi:hypothetical protein
MVEEVMLLNHSMKHGELREIALIGVASVVKKLQRAIGAGNGIMER